MTENYERMKPEELRKIVILGKLAPEKRERGVSYGKFSLEERYSEKDPFGFGITELEQYYSNGLSKERIKWARLMVKFDDIPISLPIRPNDIAYLLSRRIHTEVLYNLTGHGNPEISLYKLARTPRYLKSMESYYELKKYPNGLLKLSCRYPYDNFYPILFEHVFKDSA